MKITNRNHSRKAISPVLATVILIAITLVAAVAIATFVFGVFSSSISGPQLSINSSSVSCTNDGNAGWGICALTVHNAGGTSGQILSVGPTSTFNYMQAATSVHYAACTGFTGSAFSGASASFTVPPNSNVNVCIEYSGSGVVQGYLVQGNGPNIAFTTSIS